MLRFFLLPSVPCLFANICCVRQHFCNRKSVLSAQKLLLPFGWLHSCSAVVLDCVGLGATCVSSIGWYSITGGAAALKHWAALDYVFPYILEQFARLPTVVDSFGATCVSMMVQDQRWCCCVVRIRTRGNGGCIRLQALSRCCIYVRVICGWFAPAVTYSSGLGTSPRFSRATFHEVDTRTVPRAQLRHRS